MKLAAPAQDPAPASWDWRDHGAVSPVKNQVPANCPNYKGLSLNRAHKPMIIVTVLITMFVYMCVFI